VATGIACLVIARRSIPWFGVARPARAELGRFARVSGWLFLSGLCALVVESSDVLVLGIVLAPSLVAVFGLTSSVRNIVLQLASQILGATNAGVAGVCGEEDWPRLERVRGELWNLAIASMGVLGAPIIAMNEGFLALWVGGGYFGGDVANVLLVAGGLVVLLVSVDNLVLESMLAFSSKSVVLLLVGAFQVAAGWLASSRWGVPGMAGAVLLARVLQECMFAWLIRRRTRVSLVGQVLAVLRASATVAALYCCAALLSQAYRPESWVALFVEGALLVGLCGVVVWRVGMGRQQRQRIRDRLSAIRRGR
jgi:O-antigen/teichoic acid export membrane protein